MRLFCTLIFVVISCAAQAATIEGKAIKVADGDPLSTARLYLQLNPNEEENRALRKLLAALAEPDKAQPIRDAILFQSGLAELTAALLDARMDGRYATVQWQQASTF